MECRLRCRRFSASEVEARSGSFSSEEEAVSSQVTHKAFAMLRNARQAMRCSQVQRLTSAELVGELYATVRSGFAARFSTALSFATLDPNNLTAANPGEFYNLVGGQWRSTHASETVIDPLNGDAFLKGPNTSSQELRPFIDSLQQCTKSGLHNPLKNPERYLQYGSVSARAAEALRQPEVHAFFSRLIQRVSPKSTAQADAEVSVTQKFLENFSGDQVRFLARSFGVPGNHAGQQSNGYRWPYGPVALITPFNFPLEIPALQLLSSLYMGNKPVVKSDTKVAVVLEQFLRLLHACGLPEIDADMINCTGPVMEDLLMQSHPRMTLFTGSSRVAGHLATALQGRCKVEDAGFDWKILGPDVDSKDNMMEYVAWVCDQDAYACSGQKCSAQSMLFMHQNWVQQGFVDRLKSLAAQRNLEDLSVGPVLTVTTEKMLSHVEKLLAIPGARLEFGGVALRGGDHSIPPVYGAIEPTAVFVPLEEMLRTPEAFHLATTEIFGPLQVLTSYESRQEGLVLEAIERMHAHLTAAIVSNNIPFLNRMLGSTCNGTTYVGLRARTTGAPQNHWFGPAGDPRAAGIGTPEAIQLVWSCHREIIYDTDTPAVGWTAPKPT